MPEPDGGAPGTIVVGMDGSDTSVSALRWACDVASRSGAAVEAVITWQWPTGLGPAMAFPAGYDPEGDARTMLDEDLGPMAASHPAVVIGSRVIEGRAAEVLVEASRTAELLVVGSRGHGAFAGMLLGSVSQHCASHALCPVVIYRDRPRRSDGDPA
jgi:nucleotide-binding universal stress UspA family protein